MVRKYEARGTESGGDAFYEDWVEVVRYEDYKELDDSFQDYITTTDMEIEGLVARLAEVNAELRRLAKLVVDSPCDWKTDELAREILDL